MLDGYSQIFRSSVFGPLGFWTMAPLRCGSKLDPFLFWIAPGWRAWGRNPRKRRDQIFPSGNLVVRPSIIKAAPHSNDEGEGCDAFWVVSSVAERASPGPYLMSLRESRVSEVRERAMGGSSIH